MQIPPDFKLAEIHGVIKKTYFINLQEATKVFNPAKVTIDENNPDSFDIFSGNPIPTVRIL
jgi:hypothetical protein